MCFSEKWQRETRNIGGSRPPPPLPPNLSVVLVTTHALCNKWNRQGKSVPVSLPPSAHTHRDSGTNIASDSVNNSPSRRCWPPLPIYTDFVWLSLGPLPAKTSWALSPERLVAMRTRGQSRRQRPGGLAPPDHRLSQAGRRNLIFSPLLVPPSLSRPRSLAM